MQRFIYPYKQYINPSTTGSFVVDYDHENEEFLVRTRTVTGRVVNRISVERAAMLAGFILSKHPAIVKNDAMAFSLATRACDAIHEPEFTVITPVQGLRATTEAQDGDGDDQDVKVTVTSPGPLSAKRAGKAFADAVSHTWFAKDDEQEPGVGELHPDQERRLTALREASIIFGSDLSHDRIVGLAEWVLSGNAPTN